MAAVPSSSRRYHNNVARDQSRVHYGDVHGDAYYGDVLNNKRDMAQEILASLRFPGMNRYHERPLDSFPGTYEWIFDGISTNFRQWLTSSDEVYWVNGKAGSGKSCLMTLISEHPWTTELLQDWGGGEVTVVPFFFWAAGGELEKSQLGLMRSLLFQILDQYRELAQTCLPQRWTAHESRTNYEKPWSQKELQKGLRMILRDDRMTSRFCFLIDGLDEFDGDHRDLIECLDALSTQGFIKLLVSSRPWNVFHAAYGRSDQVWWLRLQDLTSHDMDLFITSRFENDSRFQALMMRERSRGYERFGARDILYQLRQSAEGVFLWVDLVIKTLRCGLGEHDTLAGLSKRLKFLPREIDAMLQHIFESIEPVYRQLAARSFLVLDSLQSHWTGLPVTWVAYLGHELELGSSGLPGIDVYEMEKNEQSRQAAEQMVRRCCRDLIEVHYVEGNTEELQQSTFPFRFVGRTYIRYGHRTMFDFIRSKVQDGYLQSLAGCSFDSMLSVCKLLVLVSAPALPEKYADIVREFMRVNYKVYHSMQSELELLSLVRQLINLGVRLESDGHTCCQGMENSLLSHDGFSPLSIQPWLDHYLELRVATLVGCAALLWRSERLFWSLLTAKPSYVTRHSRQAWLICMFIERYRPYKPTGTLMRLCGLSDIAVQEVSSQIDSSAAEDPSIPLLDAFDMVRYVVLNHSQIKRRMGHAAIWLAWRGTGLEKHLDFHHCKDILYWMEERNVDVQQLALSCPSPSYSVEFYWGGEFSTELMYDEQEFLRQFWPSLKQVMEHCQKVVTEAKNPTSGAQIKIETQVEKHSAASDTLRSANIVPRKRRFSIRDEM
ncbi:Vegetative incompatibility protein HET-E-1 [Pseudocercospora fuligena]|uniref:Vegetative incompatibility protein HET-E-1 n=1 Tax=Pseudocercospora fuligena TaxID=685502 RepID=A0A8H6VGY9_9PEZI|nr:Vegetative incompatibility protein HET-E-1 [Pseudocercospora fuligena]